MSVTSRFDDVAGTLGEHHRACAIAALDAALRLASECFEVTDVDVCFYADADAVIPEWAVGGYTDGPHLVRVAFDPIRVPGHNEVVSTILHELHHALRWRHTTLDTDLADMLVSEGLAVLFESTLVGASPNYARAPLETRHVRDAAESLAEAPCDTSKWFFGGGSPPRSFGYALGLRVCELYASATGATMRELLVAPTADVIQQIHQIVAC